MTNAESDTDDESDRCSTAERKANRWIRNARLWVTFTGTGALGFIIGATTGHTLPFAWIAGIALAIMLVGTTIAVLMYDDAYHLLKNADNTPDAGGESA